MRTIVKEVRKRSTLIVGTALLFLGTGSASMAQTPLGPADATGGVTLNTTGGFLQAKLDKKNDPVFQIGFTQRLDQIIERRLRDQAEGKADPKQPINHIPLIGFELQAKQSEGSGSLFGSDRLGNGARITVTLGQALVGSSIPSYAQRINALTTKLDEQKFAFKPDDGSDAFKPEALLSRWSFLEQRIIALQSAQRSFANDPRGGEIAEELAKAQQGRNAVVTLLEQKAAKTTEAPVVSHLIFGKSIRLFWRPVEGAVNYRVEKSVVGESYKQLAIVGPTVLTLTDSTIESGKKYKYRVTAVIPPPANGVPGESRDIDFKPGPALEVGGGSAQGDGSGGRFLGKPGYDSWQVQLSAQRDTYTLFDPKAAYADQFSKKDFTGFSGQIGYQANYGGSIPSILGIAIGYARGNNADELTEVEASQTQTFTSADGLERRTITSKKKGLQGDYTKTSDATIKTDFIFYPDLLNASRDPKKLRSSVALDLFTRSNLGDKNKFNWGAGAYLTQPGNPLKVYGGLNAYSDNGKFALDIVAGFNF